ncbi:MAG: hypothetical protein ACR2QM_05720 [Longimicrobiales bacterium]
MNQPTRTTHISRIRGPKHIRAQKPVLILATLGTVAALCFPDTASAQQQPLFTDDFESGLGQWTFPVGMGAETIHSGDPLHGNVLSLQTVDRIVVALMDGSQNWDDVRIEGEVLFPEHVHNYLGFVYRYGEDDGRTDLGSLYIKGNGSYIRVNPHYDLNVARTLFEEYRTPLVGDAAIEIGEWTSFALEVVGSEAHLYVGDFTRPQITFPHFHRQTGGFGFKPRNPGGAVWVDNLSVHSIPGFTYSGAPLPDIAYRTPPIDVTWDVMGPLTRFFPELETEPFDRDVALQDGGRSFSWEAFQPDLRGAVITSRVTDYEGPRKVAYFHGFVHSPEGQDVTLSLSTVDDLSIWLHGRFLGFVDGETNAWWDAWMNEDHANNVGTITLAEGDNHLIIRVVGGSYATGGFFLRLLPAG